MDLFLIIFGPPTQSRPYLGVYISVQNLVTINAVVLTYERFNSSRVWLENTY